MKFRLLLFVLIVSKTSFAQNNKLEDYKIENIKTFISLFKKRNIDSIAGIVTFPLKREYPIPSIKNEKEFKERFNQVFDKSLIKKIATSKIEQWYEVGWRGIMLDNGIVWMDPYDVRLIVVNYQSDFEKKLKNELIERDKENLHISLKCFECPKYKIKTDSFLIRIDKLADHNYRYASWKTGEKESSKPELILTDGKLNYEGSGGNHVFTFSKDDYVYKVYRNIIGEDNSPDFTLETEKNGALIKTEGGTIINE